MPTLLNRIGDFSDLRNNAGQPTTIYDPVTRQPFTGNVIPGDRLDPVALAALQYFPLPNRDGTATNANNYVGVNESSLDRDILLGRVDHHAGTDDWLTVRYYINNSGTNVTGSYPDAVADPLAASSSVRVQNLMGAHTHVFTADVVNELRVTYLRRKFIDQRPALGSNPAAALGLRGVSDQAFPVFNIPGYGSSTSTAGSASGQVATSALGSANVSRFQTPILDTQVLDSVSVSRGRHAYKFGVEYRAGANDEVRDRGSSGILTFSPLITSNLGAANTGNALASFMLGEVNAASVQMSDLIQSRASYLGLYLQDDWRVKDRLTLNYGLRWEAEFPRYEANNRQNSFDPAAINPVSGTPGVVTFAGVDGTPERAFKTDLNNFDPRLGFAYQVNELGRTVLRGGAGVFHGPTISNSIGDVAALGFSTSASFVTAQATTQSVFYLRDGFPAYARPALTPGFGAVPRGHEAEHVRRVLRSGPGGADFIPEQHQPAARDRQRRAGGSRLHGQHQPAPHGERSDAQPGADRVDGSWRHAAAASVPAVQRRAADQSVDREVQLSRRLRSCAEAVLGRVLLSRALHPLALHGRRRGRERVRHDRQLHGRLSPRARLGAQRHRRARITSS